MNPIRKTNSLCPEQSKSPLPNSQSEFVAKQISKSQGTVFVSEVSKMGLVNFGVFDVFSALVFHTHSLSSFGSFVFGSSERNEVGFCSEK